MNDFKAKQSLCSEGFISAQNPNEPWDKISKLSHSKKKNKKNIFMN